MLLLGGWPRAPSQSRTLLRKPAAPSCLAKDPASKLQPAITSVQRLVQVVTNDPSYNEQLSLYNDYWKPIGDVFLPGELAGEPHCLPAPQVSICVWAAHVCRCRMLSACKLEPVRTLPTKSHHPA